MIPRQWMFRPRALPALGIAVGLVVAMLVGFGCDSKVRGPLATFTVVPAITGTVGSAQAIEFRPREARVGDVVSVHGSRWPDGDVTIYLIPVDDRQPLYDLQRSGGLFPVGQAIAVNGEFDMELRVPESITSENGRRTLDVVPGEYDIGGEVPNSLSASGVFTILE